MLSYLLWGSLATLLFPVFYVAGRYLAPVRREPAVVTIPEEPIPPEARLL